MKNIVKYTVSLVLVLLMAIAPVAQVWADPGNPNDPDFDLTYYLMKQIEELTEANQQLTQQLNNSQGQPSATQRPAIYEPNVKLLSPQTVTVQPGETVTVDLTIKNIGTSVANNVLTQVSPGAESPFVVEFLDSTNNVRSISENNTHTMKLQITADGNAKPKTYDITLTHSYKDRNGNNRTGTDTLHIRVDGATSAPNVMLSGFKMDRTDVAPGDTFTLTTAIENMGDGAASMVQTTVEGLDPDYLYLVSDLNAAYFNKMNGKYSGTLRFTFAATPRARGAYKITFKLTYKDESGEAYENSYTYYVNVTAVGGDNGAFLDIRDLTSPSGTVGVDQNALISMQLFNSGGVPATNVEIKATAEDGKLVPKSLGTQQINSLEANTGKLLNFTFAPTAQAKSQSYYVCLHVEYDTGIVQPDGTVKRGSFDQYVAVNVDNPDAEDEKSDSGKTIKPKMIVAEYSVDPTIVKAGREFDLHLTFQNASNQKTVYGVKITLTALEATTGKGSVFTPVDGSNTFYVDEIAPKETVERTLRMYTVPDADPRSYNIAVSFEYQDEEYTDLKESEQLSINVKQLTRLETSGDPYIPESVPAGQPVSLWFSVINSGYVALSNVRVRVEGNFDTTEADIYIGNLGKGKYMGYEGRFYPNEPGDQHGEIIVYGEDDTGELVELRIPFDINVFEMAYEESAMEGGDRIDMFNPAGDMSGMVVENQTVWGKIGSFVKKPYFWGPLAGVVVAAVVFIIVRVRRKHKRIDFDE